MTQSPIDPPNNDDQTPARQTDEPATGSSLKPLTSDELVALFVAFLSLGSILFWSLTRGDISLLSDSAPPAANSALIESAPVAADIADSEIDSDEISAEPVGTASDAAQAELSGETVTRRERLAARKSVLEDVRGRAAGAAAGVTGAAMTAERVLADEPNVTVIDADNTPKNNASDVNTITASEAARTEPQEAVNFKDVPDDHWAKTYIDALSSRGLISGYENGTFRPDEPVTRSQVANIVSKTFDLTTDKENLEFSDVESDNWARESIGEVVKGGFMTGFPDETFKPNIPVTRAQALTTLVTGLGVEPPADTEAALGRYSDASEIPKWATEKMAAATANSFVVNYPDVSELNPEKPTTRAELSAMIYQALVREDIVEPVETEYVVKP
ncbi:MAG: S-layer homology domain-containing protein [Limnothrix sp.]